MSTKTQTRGNGAGVPASRRVPPYGSSSHHAAAATNGAAARGSNGAASPRHHPYANARQAPSSRTNYRIDHVVHKGVPTEVLTIEDTPSPGPSNHQAAGPSTASSKYENEPPAKKARKSDGAHISDQPYASSSTTSSTAQNKRGHAINGPAAAGSSSKQAYASTPNKGKRKLDAYQGYDAAPARTSNLPVQDKEGHYIVRVDDVLLAPKNVKYRITRPLGQGTFGKVVCAMETGSRKEYAVKVIRAVPKYREASKVEIRVLSLLRQKDPDNRYKCIHLIDVFDYKGHVCLVTELLSSSVFDFLKENSYQSFPFSQIQSFARQLITSVQFLHNLNLIHTDLKPENILLESADYRTIQNPRGTRHKTKRILKNTDIRLIDFGSATFQDDYHASVVSTRHYRAPEIILGMGWSFPCDIWSIGCILVEFWTGEALFQTHENLEHLAMMRKVFGEMPPGYINDQIASQHPDWFEQNKRATSRNSSEPRYLLTFPTRDTSKQSAKYVKQMKNLEELVKIDGSVGRHFLDLLRQLLHWDPKKRLKLKDALRHPFFDLYIKDEGTIDDDE